MSNADADARPRRGGRRVIVALIALVALVVGGAAGLIAYTVAWADARTDRADQQSDGYLKAHAAFVADIEAGRLDAAYQSTTPAFRAPREPRRVRRAGPPVPGVQGAAARARGERQQQRADRGRPPRAQPDDPLRDGRTRRRDPDGGVHHGRVRGQLTSTAAHRPRGSATSRWRPGPPRPRACSTAGPARRGGDGHPDGETRAATGPFSTKPSGQVARPCCRHGPTTCGRGRATSTS